MSDSRTQLNIKIDARTHWLASLRACEYGLTLAEFVEQLVVQGITRDARLSDEPNVEERSGPKVLWHQDLWSEDEATRLFNVARTHPGWLSRSQQKMWSAYCSQMAQQNKKPSAKSFKQFYASTKGPAK